MFKKNSRDIFIAKLKTRICDVECVAVEHHIRSLVVQVSLKEKKNHKFTKAGPMPDAEQFIYRILIQPFNQ